MATEGEAGVEFLKTEKDFNIFSCENNEDRKYINNNSNPSILTLTDINSLPTRSPMQFEYQPH